MNWTLKELSPQFYIQTNIAYRDLVQQALRQNLTLRYDSFSGLCRMSREEFTSYFGNFGGHLFYEDLGQSMYAWPNGIASVSFRGTSMSLNIVSTDSELIKTLKKWARDNLYTERQQGEVWAVAQVSASELDLVRIGIAGCDFEKGNYSPTVAADFDYIVGQYTSRNPSGRIVILEGEPGTGKTYFVRGLLNELTNCLCVTVPPGQISTLGNPDFVPLLLRHKNRNQPIVLIVEDADQCLTVRNKDNMASISSLLNLGDGIFGSAFDIRIICTTNAALEEIDPAVVRDGRLCRRSAIGNLDAETANSILNRLLGDSYTPFRGDETPILATVYKRAIQSGWVPPKQGLEDSEEDEDDDD